MLYKNMHEAIDGDQIAEFFFQQSVDAMKKLVSCATASTARGRSRQRLIQSQLKEPVENSWRHAGLS